MTLQAYQLVMRVGPSVGKVYALSKDEIYIGRDVKNEITVEDPEVSRRHCRLVLQDNRYVIEDLGSTNGTFINNQRITRLHTLQQGQSIRLGEAVTFSFEQTEVDPDATLATPSEPIEAPSAQPAAQPPQAAPSPQPSPFQPQQPGAPAAPSAPPAPEGWSERIASLFRSYPYVFGCLGLLLIGACCSLFVLWYIDANALWCDVLGDSLCQALGRLVYP